MTKISVWVQSDKGRFHPGTAIIYIDGEVHARLRGEEGYEIEVAPPQLSTKLRQPEPTECEQAGCEVHTQRCSQPQVDCIFDGGSRPPKQHTPKTLWPMSSQWAHDICSECGENWPCATAQESA
jgi:hypothetical protein